MAKNSVKAIPLASFDTVGLTAAFQVIDTAGLDWACFLVRLINDSNVDVIISYDGVNDNDYLRTGETLQLPVQTNSAPAGYVSQFSKGQKVYVRGAAAGVGSIYVSGYYTLPM